MMSDLGGNAGFVWRRYYDLKPADLGELVKLPRMGKTLHRLVHQFPRVDLAASVQPITRALLRVELTITPDFSFDQKVRAQGAPRIGDWGAGVVDCELFVR